MPNSRRLLIWVLPVAAAAIVGFAVLWLMRSDEVEPLEAPRLDIVATAPPPRPVLPTPSEAPEARPPSARPSNTQGGLHGRLVFPDLKPVRGAGRVEAVRGANLGLPGLGTASTLGLSAPLDGEGRFTLPALPVGDSIVLRLQGENFALTEAGPFLVDAGSTRALGDLIVSPGTNVIVTVLDPDGQPVPEALVGLLQTPFLPGYDELPEVEAETDESGIARFPHARSALFAVRARAEGFALAQLQSGPTPGEAPAEFHVLLKLAKSLPIEGYVLAEADGAPLAGAQVDAIPIDAGNGGGRTTTDEEGFYSIPDIAPGNYTVAARAKGYSASTLRVSAGQDRSQIELRLKKQGSLRGMVVGEDGSPITAFDLQPRSHKRRLDPPYPRTSLMRVVNAQGEFVLENLDPGFWCVEAWAQGYALTESPCVKVRQGLDVTGLLVTLKRGATLTGLVIDDSGAPIVGAAVSLHANHEPDAEFLRDTEASAALGSATRTDEQGRWMLRDLAARAFQVQVDHRDFPISRRNDVLAEAGREVEVGAFVLERAGSITGRARAPSGDPLSGVTVHLGLVGGWTRQTVTDGRGEFRFERVPKGHYELSCFGRNPSFGAMISAAVGPNKPEPFPVEPGQAVVHDVTAIE